MNDLKAAFADAWSRNCHESPHFWLKQKGPDSCLVQDCQPSSISEGLRQLQWHLGSSMAMLHARKQYCRMQGRMQENDLH